MELASGGKKCSPKNVSALHFFLCRFEAYSALRVDALFSGLLHDSLVDWAN